MFALSKFTIRDFRQEAHLLGWLCPRTDNDPFLIAAQVARRVTATFPKAHVDHQRALDLLQNELAALEARGTPAPILQGHKNLFGKTTAVEIPCPTNNKLAVHFLVYPDSPLEAWAIPSELTFPEQQLLQDLLRSLAEALAYEVEFAN